MKSRLASTAWCLACSLAAAAPARAQSPEASPATSYSLELVANDCRVTRVQLAQAIEARVPGARRVERNGEVAVHVELSERGTSSATFALPQGSSRREFPGASCEEASAIVAFITALVLDAPPADRLKATELANLPEQQPDQPRQPEPKLEPKPEPGPRLDPRAVPPDRGRTRPSRVRFGVNAALALETAVAPSPPIGGLFGASLSWPLDGWLSPELRAGLLLTGSSSKAADVGAVDFRLISGRVGVCPVRPRLFGERLVLGACATFDVGSLQAEGDSRVNGKLNAMPWLAGGLSFLAQVPLSQAFRLELEAGGRLLAYHDRFTLEPDPNVVTAEPGKPIQVYDVPVFSAGFSAGIGFQL